jgi:hypothetical protein
MIVIHLKLFMRAVMVATITLGLVHPQAAGAADSVLERLEVDVVRAEDIRTIRKLQRAYGYYADRGLWDELANLFADDAVANYPSGGFDGNASIRAMFVQNLGQGRAGLAEGRIYNHTILQPVVDLAPDGATATGRWRVLGMLGRFGGSATWADSLYRFDYVKQGGQWKIRTLTAYAGSGGGYDQGWIPPRPRPPGAADTSPVRFNLAHPADRPWIDPCEADVSACVVPFPYPNRGGIRPPAKVAAVIHPDDSRTHDRAADLVRRAQRLEDELSVLNLQRAYGYYIDRGLWQQAADLFAPDGSREVGLSGAYIGRERIQQALSLTRPRGLRAGELNDHLQLEPIIDIASDGNSASGRIFELAFVGGGGEPARIIQNVQENQYIRRGGVWMIKALHSFTILATDYHQGWGKSALPAPVASKVLPPDLPPTVVYEVYPKVFTPPLHFTSATTTPALNAATAPATPSVRQIDTAARQVQRVMDYYEIDNLQSAWGYYAEKSQWSDMAALFADDGVLEFDNVKHSGRERILASLQASGPEGPVKGVLNSQLQLQPVIHVSADGRSARLRSRLLQLTRDAQGQPMWGGGIYENELMKEDGVWKFKRLRFFRTYLVPYRNGWDTVEQREGRLYPSRFTPPFHYRNSVSGR